jgi:diguanylate cyclase (GGDEF)-like protein/PAS domain S-box-containing protein
VTDVLAAGDGTLPRAVSDAFRAAGGDVTLAAQGVCRLLARAFGDAIVLRLGESERDLRVVGVGTPDPSMAAEVIGTFGSGPAPPVVRQVMRTGAPAVVEPEGEHLVERPLLRAFQVRIGYRGSMVAPLVQDGRTIGTLSTVCTERRHDHGEHDLARLVELADHCARDIDRVALLGHLDHDVDERTLTERRRDALLRHGSDVVLVVSRTGKVLDCTPAVGRVLGWEPDQLLHVSLFEIVELADRSEVAQQLAAAATRPGPTPTTEFRVRHADGSIRWMEVTGNNLLDDPTVAALVISARDVTERHLAAELLAVENKVLQLIAELAPLQEVLDTLCLLVESRIRDCVASTWVMDGPHRLVMRAAPTIDLRPIIGDTDVVLDAGHIGLLDADHPAVLVTEVGRNPQWDGHEELARSFGIVGSWSRAVCEPSGTPLGSIVAFFGEVAEPTPDQVAVLELATHLAGLALTRDRAGRELAHAATHDALTGLPNRARFLDQLGRVLARSGEDGEVAVLFIDLDDFKTVNDTSGHAVGDQLLRQAAERLAAVVRPMDLIARLGGDEFAVLCDGIGVAEAGAIARRVLEALDRPFDLDGRSFHVSASTGIAVGNATSTPGAVLRDADTAMYQAKRQGRNRYTIFTPAVREATVRRMVVAQDLRRAIDAGDVIVHHQPIVSLATGRIVGIEALARWTSLEHGIVPPSEFVPVAEDSGLLGALSACVVGQAVAQAAQWRAAGLVDDDVTMAVNIGAQQLADPALVPTLVDALTSVGLPSSALCVELTESAVMADVEVARATLGRLGALGITLAIDDFGTGHSSLARLRSLEAAVLKLDRTFILDLEDDPGCVGMVESVVQLAHALGKRLVVEGVETAGQLAILRQLGTDAVQGFHLARPQPAAALEGLLRVSPRWD